MISTYLKWAVTICLAMAASIASALPLLNGQLDFTGNADFKTENGLVTDIVFHSARVEFGTGDFDTLTFPTPVTFAGDNSWEVSGTTLPFVLWTIDTGNFSFTLEDLTHNEFDGLKAFVRGTGFISADGYADTAGIWSITTQGEGAGVRFAFSSSTQAVPEPATVLLLGAGLIGLGFRRRKAS